MHARAISLMEPWVRVLQDVRGVAPVSERTTRFVADTRDRRGWSSADVLATMVDLGVEVPQALTDDPRFPAWKRFWAWHTTLDGTVTPQRRIDIVAGPPIAVK